MIRFQSASPLYNSRNAGTDARCRSVADYIHRVGRTGRAGAKGEAVTLFTEQDIPNLRGIALAIHEAGTSSPVCLSMRQSPPEYLYYASIFSPHLAVNYPAELPL